MSIPIHLTVSRPASAVASSPIVLERWSQYGELVQKAIDAGLSPEQYTFYLNKRLDTLSIKRSERDGSIDPPYPYALSFLEGLKYKLQDLPIVDVDVFRKFVRAVMEGCKYPQLVNRTGYAIRRLYSLYLLSRPYAPDAFGSFKNIVAREVGITENFYAAEYLVSHFEFEKFKMSDFDVSSEFPTLTLFGSAE